MFTSVDATEDSGDVFSRERPRSDLNWNGLLCDDAWTNIFSFLTPFELTHVSGVSRRFRELSGLVDLWRPHLKGIEEIPGVTYDENMRERWATEEGRRILAAAKVSKWGDRMHPTNMKLIVPRCIFYFLIPWLSLLTTFLAVIVMIVHFALGGLTEGTINPFTGIATKRVSQYITSGIGLLFLSISLILCTANWIFRFIDECWYGCYYGNPQKKCKRVLENVRVGQDIVTEQYTEIRNDWKKSNGRLMFRYFQGPLTMISSACCVIPLGLFCTLLFYYIEEYAAIAFAGGLVVVLSLYIVYMCACGLCHAPRKKMFMDSAKDYMILYRIMIMICVLLFVPWFCAFGLSFTLTSLGAGRGWGYYGLFAMMPVLCACLCTYCWCCWCTCFAPFVAHSDEIRDPLSGLPCWKDDDELKVICMGGGLMCFCTLIFVIAMCLAAGGLLPGWASLIPMFIATCCACCWFGIASIFASKQFSLCNYRTEMMIGD